VCVCVYGESECEFAGRLERAGVARVCSVCVCAYVYLVCVCVCLARASASARDVYDVQECYVYVVYV